MEASQILFIIGIVCAVIAGGFLIAAIAMFFGFRIPALRKEVSGELEQKQIDEIRKNSAASGRHGGINVFEELEKKAKVKKNNTHSLNVGTTGDINKPAVSADNGTSVLKSRSKPVNPNFIIEKDIMFVSTNEVM